jgi:hypothetical protein
MKTQSIDYNLFSKKINGYIRVVLNIRVVSNLSGGLNYGMDCEYSGTPDKNSKLSPMKDEKIIINLYLTNRFSDSEFNSLFYRLSEGVKHELDHKRIFNENPDSSKEIDYIFEDLKDQDISRSFVPRVNYILSNVELEPYVRGLMHRARKQGKLFEDLISETINRVLYNGSVEVRKKAIDNFGENLIAKSEKNIYDAFIEKKNEIFKGAFNR